ncbi:MAG: transposase [Oligoflexales bacterium]|nr:transposase [Oligoflexales bacterium]
MRESSLFLKNLIENLQYQVKLLKAFRFSHKSEKISPNQMILFNEVELEAQKKGVEKEQKTDIEAHSRKKPKRRPLPEILPREEIIYDLSEEEKIGKRKIGEEISEQLKWEPAKVSVIRNIRYKYSTENDGIITAPMPPQPIPKSNDGEC